MGLFSFFRKKPQESTAGNSDFYSQSDEQNPAPRSRRKASNKREEPVDPVLPEKKRARRRLIGAIALVVAAVIGLPMILDSEPKPLADDISIQIPSKDSAAAPSQTKPDESAASREADVASINLEEDIVEPVPAPVAKVIKPEAKPSEKALAAPVLDAHTKADDSGLSSAKPASPVVPTHKTDESARARAILDGKVAAVTTPGTPTGTPGKIVLQVAALTSREKVDELQKKLQDAGLKSFTQKVSTDSGERIRVRVGPFANEAEADKARAKLTKLGLSGKLIPA